MSSAWNPNTIDYVASANTPDFPAPWVVNHAQADALFAAGVPLHYWKSVGGIATEMTPAEKSAVDAAILEASRDGTASRNLDNFEAIARAIALAMLDGFNSHANKITQILNAIDSAASLADLKTQIAAIADPPQRTPAEMRTAIRNKLGT